MDNPCDVALLAKIAVASVSSPERFILLMLALVNVGILIEADFPPLVRLLTAVPLPTLLDCPPPLAPLPPIVTPPFRIFALWGLP